jgi:transcriptional regulator with XRE-family HTH domain
MCCPLLIGDGRRTAGLTVSADARIERGEANPTWTTVTQIAQALEITQDIRLAGGAGVPIAVGCRVKESLGEGYAGAAGPSLITARTWSTDSASHGNSTSHHVAPAAT